MNVEQLESQAAKAAAAAEAAAAKAEAARQAREKRVDDALLADTDRLWKQRRIDAQTNRNNVVTAYEQTLADPEATLEDLWDAFVGLRTTSAATAGLIGYATAMMDQYRPLPPNHRGVTPGRGGMHNDPYQHLTFADVLASVATKRAEAAKRAAIASEEAIRAKAVAEAEKD